MFRYGFFVAAALFATTGAAKADNVCVQSRLKVLGFDGGPADGVIGKRTQTAASAYSASAELQLPELTDETSEQWCLHLAEKTTGLPGFETDTPPGIDLFDYSNSKYCRTAFIVDAPSSPVIKRKRPVLEPALKWFNSAISTAKVQPENAMVVAAKLADLARKQAFVKLNWSGKGSSPAHWQTNLLKNIAIAVNILDHHQSWRPGQRATVVNWGNKIYVNSRYSSWGRRQSDRWPDTVAAAAAAYVSWGVVAPNAKALAEGRQDFDRVARMLRSSGGTRAYFGSKRYLKYLPRNWGARIEDKMLGDLVIAAHASGRAGVDLFNRKVSKTSLYSAIVGWQNTLFANDGKTVRGEDLSFLTIDGEERSWSWTEYFVSNYPDDQRTELLRKKSASIRASDWLGYGFIGRATGPSSCLFGPT